MNARDEGARAPGSRWLRWSMIVLIAGAVIGGALGWMSETPIYASEGIVVIDPIMPSKEDPRYRASVAMFRGFAYFQQEVMKSHRLVALALESDAWEAHGTMSKDAFDARRHVELRGIECLRVQFEHEDPEAAQAGVHASLEAFLALSAELNNAEDRVFHARAELKRLAARKTEVDEKIKRAETPAAAERLTHQRSELTKKEERMQTLLEQLEAQLLGKGRVRVVDKGVLPTAPVRDRRLEKGAVGAALGMAPGLLLLLCFGLARMTAPRRDP